MTDQPNPSDSASESRSVRPDSSRTHEQPREIPPPQKRRWGRRILIALLVISVLVNFWLYGMYQDYFTARKKPIEKFHSGSATALDKIAIIRVQGTIMPPLTERVLREIKQAREDDAVKGVLLTVDSPGGLVADSHQIYDQLQKLHQEDGKPVFVAMKRLAASGGYYIAMGAGPEGKIFAEPTTWTGSIGVIIPRYDISELAENWHIKSAPLKTGKFKDALSPFRPLTPGERQIWAEILNESFAQFLTVIDESRPALSMQETEEPTEVEDPDLVPTGLALVSTKTEGAEKTNLATGQIFTASKAQAAGLVDEIGFEEEALEQLQEKLGLEDARIVKYQSPLSLWEAVLGLGQAHAPEAQQKNQLDATVPRAMYYYSWVPPAIPRP